MGARRRPAFPPSLSQWGKAAHARPTAQLTFQPPVQPPRLRWVAIKEFKIDDSDPDAEDVKRTSRREVALLRELQHPNVVELVDEFYVRCVLWGGRWGKGGGGHQSATPSQPRSPADPCLLGGLSKVDRPELWHTVADPGRCPGLNNRFVIFGSKNHI
jgi:hypothetical protein